MQLMQLMQIDAIGRYLVGKVLFKKKTFGAQARYLVHVLCLIPRHPLSCLQAERSAGSPFRQKKPFKPVRSFKQLK